MVTVMKRLSGWGCTTVRTTACGSTDARSPRAGSPNGVHRPSPGDALLPDGGGKSRGGKVEGTPGCLGSGAFDSRVSGLPCAVAGAGRAGRALPDGAGAGELGFGDSEVSFDGARA